MNVNFTIQNIKNTFLKVRAFLNERKQEFVRNTKNYNDTRKIGVLFSSELNEDFQSLERFVRELKKDKKQVEVLVFEPNSTPEVLDTNTTRQYQYFSYRDISLLGDIKNEELKSFSTSQYDCICCVSSTPQPILEHILKTTDTGCRIGNYYTNSDVFELTVETQTNHNLSESFKDILRYWKNISRN